MSIQRAQRIYHKKVRDLSTRPPRQTNLVATRVSSFSLTTPTPTTSSLGYAASATEGASTPLLSDPHATTSTSSNGVAVGSLYQGGSNSSRGTGASARPTRPSACQGLVPATTSRGETRRSSGGCWTLRSGAEHLLHLKPELRAATAIADRGRVQTIGGLHRCPRSVRPAVPPLHGVSRNSERGFWARRNP